MSEVYDKLLRCYHSVREKVSFEPQIALILGSGLGDYAEHIQVEAVLDYHEIEGFPVCTGTQRTFRVWLYSGRPCGNYAGQSTLL